MKITPRSFVGIILFLFSALMVCAGPPPANDDFADRILLAGNHLTVDGSNDAATLEPGENSYSTIGPPIVNSVWYQWVAPADGVLQLSTSTPVPNLFLSVMAYRGSALSGLHLSSDTFGNLTVHAGDVIQIQVASTILGVESGSFTLQLNLQSYALNDNFVNRIELTGTNVTVTGANTFATTQTGENLHTADGVPILNSVWYEWTSPADGVLHLTGSTLVYDFILSAIAYRGTNVSALIPAPLNLDGSIPVLAGEVIAIQVASAASGYGAGDFSLQLGFEFPVPHASNDLFAGAISITSDVSHFDSSLYQATTEPGEPLPDPSATQTVWWTFVPTGNGMLRTAVTASEFATWLTVYEGTNLASLSPVSKSYGDVYRLLAGHSYAVQVASGFVATGGFSFDAWFSPDSYDNFAGAVELTGTNATFLGNFSLATAEPGEPIPSGATNTVWLKWTAPSDCRATYTLAVIRLDQYRTVYTGTNPAALNAVPLVGATTVNPSFLAFAGQTYYFQVAGPSDNFKFNVTAFPLGAPGNDAFTNAQVMRGQGVLSQPVPVSLATTEPGEPAHLGPIPQKSVWWQWQAPLYGIFNFSAAGSLATNVLLAAYSGNSLATLTLITKGTNNIRLAVSGGDMVYIAAVVPTNVPGDVVLAGGYASFNTSLHPVPGNLLQDPSWEGTALFGVNYWQWAWFGGMGGQVNTPGVDGVCYPTVGPGQTFWQDIPTIPGHLYRVRYTASLMESGLVDAQLNVLFDATVLGTAVLPHDQLGIWEWFSFLGYASNTTTRVTFQNLNRSLNLDDFSVVDDSIPPSISNQPSSAEVYEAGAVQFSVGAIGDQLTYQWYFNGAPLTGASSPMLLFTNVSTNQAGNYTVVIANGFGVVTSAVASLTVDAAPYPVIVWQPYGDTLAPGAPYTLSVSAVGKAPLNYQWYFQGAPLAGATNQLLALAGVDSASAGTYFVSVQNAYGTNYSLPATLQLDAGKSGGGTVSMTVPGIFVYDVDGLAKLTGTNFLFEAYVGLTLADLRASGMRGSIRLPGRIVSSGAPPIPNVPSGVSAVMQIRVWDSNYGNSYEEARARGGKYGKSALATVMTGGGAALAGLPTGISSFQLQVGLPAYTSAVISFSNQQPDGTLVWNLTGAAGCNYLVEMCGTDGIWRPYQVFYDSTGIVQFTTTNSGVSGLVLYRARILD